MVRWPSSGWLLIGWLVVENMEHVWSPSLVGGGLTNQQFIIPGPPPAAPYHYQSQPGNHPCHTCTFQHSPAVLYTIPIPQPRLEAVRPRDHQNRGPIRIPVNKHLVAAILYSIQCAYLVLSKLTTQLNQNNVKPVMTKQSAKESDSDPIIELLADIQTKELKKL